MKCNSVETYHNNHTSVNQEIRNAVQDNIIPKTKKTNNKNTPKSLH